MVWRAFQLILAGLALGASGSAEERALSLRSGLAEPGWFKVSHQYLLAFNVNQKIRGRDSVEAFDREGLRVLGLDVLRQLPGVTQISLDDISMRPGGPLVIGGTVRAPDGRLQDVLLYFNLNGMLLWRIDLPPSRGINRLDLDEAGNVWTLADYSGRNDDEPTGPLIFVYDGTGRLTKSLLRRSDYRAGFRESVRDGGVVGFGLTGDGVWFWQPVRHRMTVVSREGAVVKRSSIAFPRPRGDSVAHHTAQFSMISLLSTGQAVAGVACPCPNDVPVGAYVSRGKRFVRGASQSLLLIGIDGPDFVFLKHAEPGQFEIVRDSLPAAAAKAARG